MALSSMLLMVDNPMSIITLFNSVYGKQVLLTAYQELLVLQEYCKNLSSNIHRGSLNDGEVKDIAYSYHCYKKTGECKRCVYADKSEKFNRFNQPNMNYEGDFVYNKTDIFSLKTVWEVLKNPDANFCVPESDKAFNDFAKQWISSSDTLMPIKSINALGYDNAGNFGYNKIVNGKDLDKNTYLLLTKLIDYANSPSVIKSEVSRIDFVLSELTVYLAGIDQTNLVFGVNYNYLNNPTRGGDNPQGFLYRRMTQLLSFIDDSSDYGEQIKAIVRDAIIVFQSQTRNSFQSNIVDAESFIDNINDYLKAPYNNLTSEDKSFIVKLFSSYKSVIKNFPNSTVSIVMLYKIFTSVDFNQELGLNFKGVDYLNASEQLFNYFCVPFYFGSSELELWNLLGSGFGISKEESRLKPPNDNLLRFTYQLYRTVKSKEVLSPASKR